MKISVSILATAAVFILASGFAAAKPPEMVNDMQQALTSASQEQKLTFLLLGRPTCSICNGTKEMIRNGKIPVTAAHYVMADLNVDDSKVHGAFMQKFKGQNFGNTLPFVAITDSTGKLVASSGGYKSAEEWTALLNGARKKAGPAAGAAPATGGTAKWPFQSTPPAQ